MASLPPLNADYNTKDYWDSRYKKNGGSSFDWFKTYSDIKPLLIPFITATDTILMLGCGNSDLSKDLFNDGYKQIINVDFSPILIEQMADKHSEMHEMKWIEADVRDLRSCSIEDASIDVAIDKGTMDALMCDIKDVWNPELFVVENVRAEVDEVVRVLKPGGRFIYITFGQPHFRRLFLERPETWRVEVERIGGDGFDYFVYKMLKF